MASTLALKEDVWYLKKIRFGDRIVKIITQNFNGPCSFIAICNILILREDIEILPKNRRIVSYEFLSQLVAEYLLTHCAGLDISAALSVMPLTTKGMDLNPLFSGATSFRPGSSSEGKGGELDLFAQTGIKLVHGWLVDPSSPECAAVTRAGDYDTAVNLLVEADELTHGNLVQDQSEPEANPGRPSMPQRQTTLHGEALRKVEDAIHIKQFLDTTSSQLTYHGLFTLSDVVKPGTLVALFRNSHLSVLYRPPHASPSPPDSSNCPKPNAPSDPNATNPQLQSPTDAPPGIPPPPSALYTLATDYAFLHEPTVVWERFEDVDGSSTAFVDAHFRPAAPLGGDFAGAVPADFVTVRTPPPGLVSDEQYARRLGRETAAPGELTDEQYALRLQREDDLRYSDAVARHKALAREEREKREERRRAQQEQLEQERRDKKKGDCTIM